ncbi:MAG: formate--phosphoribosylaminoimidazolecarboxamide ligase [Promethearchaeota archaeon]
MSNHYKSDFYIGTIGSHSALNILSGAKKEGFITKLFCTPARQEFYSSFGVADKIHLVDQFSQILKQKNNLLDTILIPHGSFIAYLNLKELKSADLKIFGDIEVLEWESDRIRKNELLKKAGLKVPQEFTDVSRVKKPVIAKTNGAAGGKGYFIALNQNELQTKLEKSIEPVYFQEYILGTKVFVHFFHSLMRNRLEISSVDIRYETDVDSKLKTNIAQDPTFQVVGNIPLTIRESILSQYYEMGKAFVKATAQLLSRPIFGPFCLETIIDRDLNIYCFEFSGRIVAGTTPFIPYSPYSYVMFGKKMWTGRRISLEIREALEQQSLEKVLA